MDDGTAEVTVGEGGTKIPGQSPFLGRGAGSLAFHIVAGLLAKDHSGRHIRRWAFYL